MYDARIPGWYNRTISCVDSNRYVYMIIKPLVIYLLWSLMYQHQSNIMIKISILKIRDIKIQNTRFRNKKHPLSFTKTPNQKYRKHPFCMTKNTRRVQQYVLMVVKLKTHGLTTENIRFQVSKHSSWHYTNTRLQWIKNIRLHMFANTRFQTGSAMTETHVFNFRKHQVSCT